MVASFADEATRPTTRAMEPHWYPKGRRSDSLAACFRHIGVALKVNGRRFCRANRRRVWCQRILRKRRTCSRNRLNECHSHACRSREQALAATQDQFVDFASQQSVDPRPRHCARFGRRPPGLPSQNVSAGSGQTEEYIRRLYLGLLPDCLGVRLAADRHSRDLRHRLGWHLNGELRDKRNLHAFGRECKRRVPQFFVSKVRDSGNTSHPFFGGRVLRPWKTSEWRST